MLARQLKPKSLNSSYQWSKAKYATVGPFQAGPDQVLPAKDHRAWLPDGAVKLRLTELGPQSQPPISVPSLVRRTVERSPDNLALHTRDRLGQDVKWSYSQYYQDIRTVAKGFISLGLEPYHTVGILGHNSPEWLISNIGAVHAGGFATGIYQTNTKEACHYIADDSRANIIVVDDEEQLNKILAIKDNLKHLKAIVKYGGEASNIPGVISWQELLKIGQAATENILDERLKAVAVNQCCLLVYTSGTTGNPKGTMLSHDAVTYSSIQNTDFFYYKWGEEAVLSYLPLSHIAGQMMDIYIPLACGGSTCFADKNALKGTLIENLKYYRTTRFVGVPRVFEKIEESIKDGLKKAPGPKQKIVNWAMGQALGHHEREMSGVADNSLGYKLAKKLVLSKVHQGLGLDRTVPNDFAIGAAAVSPDTVRFFLSLDMKVLEMITSTEATAMMQITNQLGPGNFRVGKVGRVYPDQQECKIVDLDNQGIGELLSRSRANAMGYLNNKEKTKETIDDEGWLHSGDLVKEDEEGWFTVVGRSKEIIITAGGENIAPTNIEEQIKKELSEVVSNVMVVGDGKKYLTCLLTLKVDIDLDTQMATGNIVPQALSWMNHTCGDSEKTIQSLVKSSIWPKVAAEIQAGLDRANTRAVSNVATVKKWRLVERDFTVGGGELSPSLKLKRFYVAELYENIINEMYEK